MVMLSVYFDESYNQPTQKEFDIPLVYTIAGYLSTVEQWNAFQKEWNKALKSVGIPFFHMTDFESRFGFYEGWSNEKRINFLQKLHNIIHKYVLKGFASTIALSEYNTLTDEQKSIFGDPHMCALISCMKHMVKVCDEFDFQEPISYVFEHSKFDGEISTLFKNMSDTDRKGYRAGSISFSKKDESCRENNVHPLQASDILAYEVMKQFANQKNNNKRKIRKSIRNLAVSRIDEWFYMDREHFIEVLKWIKNHTPYDIDV